MKIKSVSLSNIGKYDKVNVSFDENITYLIGKNGAGKSTIGITAIHFIMKGIAEKGPDVLIGERFRFIGNNALSGSGQLILVDEKRNNAEIIITRRITKSGNELSFQAPEGYAVDKEWLDNIFNIFLIAPKRFTSLTAKQQAEAIGLDTSSIDAEITALKSEYTLINRDLTNIGQIIPMDPVDYLDVSELNKQKNEIIEFNQIQVTAQETLDKIDAKINNLYTEADDIGNEIIELENKIAELKVKGNELLTRIENGKKLREEATKPLPLKSLFEIDQKLNNASEQNEKYFKYSQYLEKLEKKKSLEKILQNNKSKQQAKGEERIEYIKSQKLPFDNLEINEHGELLLNSKPIKEPYFSTGELLKIVPLLMAAKSPELKYVFIQDFNLLDEDMQNEVEQALVNKGMQLVIECVGTKKVDNKSCILLKDCKVVEDYHQEEKNILV